MYLSKHRGNLFTHHVSETSHTHTLPNWQQNDFLSGGGTHTHTHTHTDTNTSRGPAHYTSRSKLQWYCGRIHFTALTKCLARDGRHAAESVCVCVKKVRVCVCVSRLAASVPKHGPAEQMVRLLKLLRGRRAR